MTRNQIDHFCVARKFRSSFNGVTITISLTKILPVTTMHLPVAAMKLEVESKRETLEADITSNT